MAALAVPCFAALAAMPLLEPPACYPAVRRIRAPPCPREGPSPPELNFTNLFFDELFSARASGHRAQRLARKRAARKGAHRAPRFTHPQIARTAGSRSVAPPGQRTFLEAFLSGEQSAVAEVNRFYLDAEVDARHAGRLAPGEGLEEAELPCVEVGGGKDIAYGQGDVVLLALNRGGGGSGSGPPFPAPARL